MAKLTLKTVVSPFLVMVGCCIHAGYAELFPEKVSQLKFNDPLMPNEENSVKDCPFTVYKHGGYALASSIFADRYVDKTYSHTVRVINGETTCVGLIVDESHVLTVSECTPDDDDVLPQVKLLNETLPPIETDSIFRNPEYNVTILRLNSSIALTTLAVPSCFWDVSFEDGFEKIQNIFVDSNGTLTLEETKCTLQNRKDCLDGLQKTDTIVQTRAIAAFRMHPFVLTFGSDDEGVALPVSKYVEWIEKVTEGTIKSSECVSRYQKYREFEDSMVSRSDNFQSVQYSKSRLSSTTVSQFKVRIVPNATETGSKRHCYGSLIAPKFILAAANCLKRYDVDSYTVEMGQQSVYYPKEDFGLRVRIEARNVHYHPKFNAETLANDIALLELVTPITEFNKSVVPACIWSYDKLPVTMYQTNGYAPFNGTEDETVRTKQLYATADVLEDCAEKTPEHTVCAGFPTALAPNWCHNSAGSAMSRSLYTFERYYEYIFAINSRGENCGFNMPTRYTLIAPYVQWIDSVIFADKVHYKDNSKYYGDHCQNGDGVEGTCVPVVQCPRIEVEIKKGKTPSDMQKSAGPCSFDDELTVCCTAGDLLRDEVHRERLAQITAEIDDCPHLYHEYRKNKSPYTVDNFPTYPYMVRIHDKGDRSCNGTLVAKQFVLTSAGCYRTLDGDQVTIVTGNSTRQNVPVKHALVHPQYSDNPTLFNLMLLKLETAITVDNETIPACLWHNGTHTPLRLQEIYAKPQQVEHQYRYPLFNAECRRRNSVNVSGLEVCVEQDSMFYHPYAPNTVDSGNPLISNIAHGVQEYQVTYLVGLFGAERTIESESDSDDNSGEAPPRRYYSVYQRISEYYNWIKHAILLEVQQS